MSFEHIEEYRPEEEQIAAEDFNLAQGNHVVKAKEEIGGEVEVRSSLNKSDQEKYDKELYEKARESFWLEKHGLLPPPLVNRLRESSLAYLRKGGRRLLAFLGAATALAGYLYLEKDEIVNQIDVIMKSHTVTTMLERSWGDSSKIEPEQQLTKADVSMETVNKEEGHDLHRYEFRADATINLHGTKIDLHEIGYLDRPSNDLNSLRDNGSKIELTSPYLRNFTRLSYGYVNSAADPARFSQFIHDETMKQLDYAGAIGTAVKDLTEESHQAFSRGEVGEFISVVNGIVRNNLEYDQSTADWLGTSEAQGRSILKWGGNNPFTAFLSSDHTPVDQLLIDKKIGVCRHYAEAFSMVAEEVKRQNPDKFQNIYIVPILSAYQMHEYDVVYVAQGPEKAKMFVIDPTSGEDKGSPAFELFKTMYYRGMIDQNLYSRLAGEYFENGGTEDSNDALAFLGWGLATNNSESLQACRSILSLYIHRFTTYMREEKTENGKRKLQKEFQNKLWPYIQDYQQRTGEKIYHDSA